MRSRILASILLMITGTLVFLGASDAPAQDKVTCLLCDDARTIPCPTCKGKGRAVLACDTCGGGGRPTCGDLATSPTSDLDIRHEGKVLECPNDACSKGKIEIRRGLLVGCKLCKKRGTVKCRSCQVAAREKCAACRGRGKLQRECDDCSGSGKLACLPCAVGPKCGACGGKEARVCPRCRGAKEAPQACGRCMGVSKSLCKSCSGVSKTCCVDCDATGLDQSEVSGTSTARAKKCSSCGGKGVDACVLCKKGVAACDVCDGAKRHSSACRLCSGTGDVACRTCGAYGFRGAELQAGLLAAKGHDPVALTLYERARKRVLKTLTEAHERISAVADREPELPNVRLDGTGEELRSAVRALEQHNKKFALYLIELERATDEQAAIATAALRINAALKALKSNDAPDK